VLFVLCAWRRTAPPWGRRVSGKGGPKAGAPLRGDGRLRLYPLALVCAARAVEGHHALVPDALGAPTPQAVLVGQGRSAGFQLPLAVQPQPAQWLDAEFGPDRVECAQVELACAIACVTGPWWRRWASTSASLCRMARTRVIVRPFILPAAGRDEPPECPGLKTWRGPAVANARRCANAGDRNT
jgi:hypothetical protein